MTTSTEKRKKKKVEPYMVCPDCGYRPLLLTGKKTLSGFRKCKAVCNQCLYEEKF